MKELIIEQKAKAYDNLIERLKDFQFEYRFSAFSDTIDRYFPELKESEDEKSKKWILEYLHDGLRKSDEQFKDQFKAAIDWLEKQGKQPNQDNYVKDYNSIDPHFGKPIDNVEPKFNFNVGQWIVATGKCVYLITKIDGFNVTLVNVHGDEYVFDTSSLDDAHLWTIRDARAGDILSDGTTVFIFKDLLSDGSVMSYCDYDTDSGESDAFCPLSMNLMCSKITPATKEQRDTLEKAIADAGWEFDFEKKELKKIEDDIRQKPAWSEKDEHWRQKAIDFMKHPDLIKATPTLAKDTIDWLQSLKDRVQLQSKQEWSEKDENRINRLIAYFEDKESFSAEDDMAYANWLKSLKDRIQPKQEWSEEDETYSGLVITAIKLYYTDDKGEENPWREELLRWFKSLKNRYTWKPSEEQMKVLDEAIAICSERYYGTADRLDNLRQDLKKLREE